MSTISRDRYQFEVQTFVWDFLLKVVAVGLSMTSVFTMMSDELLGVSRTGKMMVLMPQLLGSVIVFGLQLGIMALMHAVFDTNNYAAKSRAVLTVACLQFLCVVFNFITFMKLLPVNFEDTLRQIDYFYWILAVSLGTWLFYNFVTYLTKILFYDPRAETA